MLTTYIALGIFTVAFAFIVIEIYDKSLVALSGALLMILFGILSPEEAVRAIDFETILLLLAMMMLAHIASESGIFSWLNVKIASLTRGNPLAIFLFFSLITGLLSTFLNNVTTVILIVPLTIELIKGMGKDPKPYVMAEIIFSNVGGALTLVGDPPNTIIGGATGFNFLAFIRNLGVPILASSIFVLLVFMILNRKDLRSISKDFVELFIANVIIKKVKNKFLKTVLHKDLIIAVSLILIATIVGFSLQDYTNMPSYIIAFTGATLLAILTAKRVSVHDSFRSVEWSTLFFFAGLFIMVGGVEKTGFLDQISLWIGGSTDNLLYLSLIVLWVSGIISMVLDNIPFVTVMIPVIIGVQSQFVGVDTSILWWALSLGACLGGNGTLIGASSNIVSVDLAKKEGLRISFLDYMKFALPLTLGILVICSGYLYIRLT